MVIKSVEPKEVAVGRDTIVTITGTNFGYSVDRLHVQVGSTSVPLVGVSDVSLFQTEEITGLQEIKVVVNVPCTSGSLSVTLQVDSDEDLVKGGVAVCEDAGGCLVVPDCNPCE